MFRLIPCDLAAGMKADYKYVGGADSLDNETAQIPCGFVAGSVSFYSNPLTISSALSSCGSLLCW
jgi:hypothetical protein